jgi:hypothetical protein
VILLPQIIVLLNALRRARDFVAEQQRIESTDCIKRCDVIVATDVLAVDENLRHACSSRALTHLLLELACVNGQVYRLEVHAFARKERQLLK